MNPEVVTERHFEPNFFINMCYQFLSFYLLLNQCTSFLCVFTYILRVYELSHYAIIPPVPLNTLNLHYTGCTCLVFVIGIQFLSWRTFYSVRAMYDFKITTWTVASCLFISILFAA